MLPRRIEFLDRLPRSANGKFDRALLRERTSHQSEDEMGLT
jgi:acyl-CoA synthetase (AMP-forming)/AMP-acid ligase II